jgi:hypothetical protein
MVKQYIGARYVPVFDGEYNPEKAYEPLTIVTYLNNSYTSKKTVPAGTLPSNTEYWALTGNYNAQIEEYRQEVEGYREDVEAYQDATNTRIDNLSDTLSGRHFVLIGDSLGMGTSVEGGEVIVTKGWIGHAMDRIGHDHCTYASQIGGGFCVDAPYTWLLQLQNTVVATGDDSVTDVVILGGTNDQVFTPAQVKTAIGEMVTYCRSRFKNLKRIAVGAFCEPRFVRKVHDRYKAIRDFGGEFIVDMENLLCDATKYDSTRDTHLSEAGYAFYAPYSTECVVTGHTEYKFEFKITDVTLGPNVRVITNQPVLYIRVFNNRYDFCLNKSTEDNCSVMAPVNAIHGSTPLLLKCNTNEVFIRGGDTEPFGRTGSIPIFDTDATTLMGNGNLSLGTYDYFGYNAIYINGDMVSGSTIGRYAIGQNAGGTIFTDL